MGRKAIDRETMQEMIEVEVVYAEPAGQKLITLKVPVGTTAMAAVQQSGITQDFPSIDLDSATFGIFSRPLDGRSTPTADEYIMQEGDRVEIYRPLLIDPKQARLRRAAKAKGKA